MYKIKKIENSEIDRSLCNTIIVNSKNLIEKPKKNEMDIWWSERLCIYENRFIWFKDEKKRELFASINLVPYEVCEDFFNAKIKEWKKQGSGYYVVL